MIQLIDPPDSSTCFSSTVTKSCKAAEICSQYFQRRWSPVQHFLKTNKLCDGTDKEVRRIKWEGSPVDQLPPISVLDIGCNVTMNLHSGQGKLSSQFFWNGQSSLHKLYPKINITTRQSRIAEGSDIQTFRNCENMLRRNCLAPEEIMQWIRERVKVKTNKLRDPHSAKIHKCGLWNFILQ